jgi:hypothetical protein
VRRILRSKSDGVLEVGQRGFDILGDDHHESEEPSLVSGTQYVQEIPPNRLDPVVDCRHRELRCSDSESISGLPMIKDGRVSERLTFWVG